MEETLATVAPSASTAPPARGPRRLIARHPRVSGYLLRSLLLVASTIIIVTVVVVAMTAWGISNSVRRYDETDGYLTTGGQGEATWSSVAGYSVAGNWYAMLGSLGAFLPVAAAIMLLLVQPAMEVSRRWVSSAGLRALLGLVPIAVVGVGVSVLVSIGLSSGGALSFFGSAAATSAWISVVYGVPILLVAAFVIGLATLAEHRVMQIVVLVVAAVVTVAVVIGSIGVFRPASEDTAVDRDGPATAVAEFEREISGLAGVVSVDVLGAGATVVVAAEADAASVIAAAEAARDAADADSEIVLVVLERQALPGSAASRTVPATGQWRVQLVPSEFPSDTLPTQIQRALAAEALGVTVVHTGVRPAITVPSIAALPDAVHALEEIYPDGAYYSVADRFSMALSPSTLSRPMVDAVLAAVAANPDAEYEVTEQPKLSVDHVTPEAAAAIEAILQDPALAGTSPSGVPVEYQIRTSGPDGDIVLEGVFG
ncbi:hypothetical protein KXS11_09180 [Plantibacter flavus]|uniref:hypothetical protein n=1 Tax=Plantibacter flavus TaxID=150123 RepID=UPI003F19015C